MPRARKKENRPPASPFEQTYPRVTRWVKAHGWIEFGRIDGFSSFALALDEGGMVWSGKRSYKSIDEALRALEEGLAAWMKEQHGE